MKKLQLSVIKTDGGTQPRAEINAEVVAEYADAMRDGAEFPPVVVFFDGTNYWCADGFHRIQAMHEAGFTYIMADIRQGTLRDAQWFSFGANKDHGLRRCKGDSKRAIEKILTDPEWSKIPQSQIAAHVGVSDAYVSQVKVTIKNLIVRSDGVTFTTKHGTTATMNTANIGKTRDEATERLTEYQMADDGSTEANTTRGTQPREERNDETDSRPVKKTLKDEIHETAMELYELTKAPAYQVSILAIQMKAKDLLAQVARL